MVFNGLQVDVLFPDEFTDMIAEISYEHRFVCRITQELGFEDLRIEIMNNELSYKWEFSYSDFCEAIEYAKQRLWELRRVSNIKIEDEESP